MPAVTVNGFEKVPPVLTVTARERARALHDTGSVSTFPTTLMLTVGCDGSSLHSSGMPMVFGSKPDPLRSTTAPPMRQVPGVTVMVTPLLLAVTGWALHGRVVVVVEDVVVVVVVTTVNDLTMIIGVGRTFCGA